MTRDMTADMINALIAQTVRPLFLAEIATLGGTVYAWSGVGTLVWSSKTYLGMGNFGGVTAVQETSDLAATSVQFSLSGLNDANLDIALQNIKQAYTAILYLGAMDSSYNLIADPYKLFAGFTDVPEIVENGDTCTITISAESRMVDLSRSRARRYTSADQKLTDPTDLGFDYVPSLQDAIIHFGG